MTVEIGYALVSAAFVAAVMFGVVVGPTLIFDLPHAVDRSLLMTGICLAAPLFLLRVVTVLFRFRRESLRQPSHPGRTNPDS